MELKELECTIEGILFAAGDPVPVERMAATLEQDVETVDSVCRKLADEYRYQRRGHLPGAHRAQLADVHRPGVRRPHP